MTSGFGLVGAWKTATERVIDMMTEGVDPRETTLPIGLSSSVGVERYARAYCDVNPRASLAIVYGVNAVGVCTAAQGAFVGHCPIKGGGWLKIPAIQYFIGISPSGTRKSTALDVARDPLRRSLAWGVRDRAELLLSRLSDAKQLGAERLKMGQTEDEKQYLSVYNSGYCPDTLIRETTTEGLRDFAIANGGVVAVFSGEADFFRNISAYSPNDSGSLTFLLDLWSQDGISTARSSKGHMSMEEVALQIAVLFQTDVFTKVTGGDGPGGDSYVTRGVFGRCHVVEATELGGFEAIAEDYADDQDFTYVGPDGVGIDGGELTPLGLAMYDYERALRRLVEDSNPYRVSKALRRGWEVARATYGTDLQVPEVHEMERTVLHLDQEARLAYRRVQRMQLAMEAALERTDDEDVKAVFSPLAARWTQHVMREAIMVTLGADQRTLTGGVIADAATRLMPWRVAHTACALLRRRDERAEDVIGRAAEANPNAQDRSVRGRVLAMIAKMVMSKPTEREVGYTRGEITLAVSNTIYPKSDRKLIRGPIANVLEELVATPDSGIMARIGTDAVGKPTTRYVMELAVAEKVSRQ